jgi:hypothetical protein
MNHKRQNTATAMKKTFMGMKRNRCFVTFIGMCVIVCSLYVTDSVLWMLADACHCSKRLSAVVVDNFLCVASS